jgi:deoxyadenosine/deoxycytidine kinase
VFVDPPKYALVMQLWLLKQRFRTYINAIKHVLETGTLTYINIETHPLFFHILGKGGILDRSVFSDWVFAEKNRLDGNISEEGFREYLNERNQMLAHLPKPQITVYLDVSPQECYRRVHELRKRV